MNWPKEKFFCLVSVFKIAIVPKKKKLKRFSATSTVKAASRAVLGTPPPVKRAENKKHAKKEKYKPSLDKLLSDTD